LENLTREKKPRTEAQKLAFERMREVRMQNIENKKKQIEEIREEQEKISEIVIDKKEKKEYKKEVKKIIKEKNEKKNQEKVQEKPKEKQKIKLHFC
jgi:hypothetical protein